MSLFAMIVALFIVDAVVYSRFLRGGTSEIPKPDCPRPAAEPVNCQQACQCRNCTKVRWSGGRVLAR